MEADRAEPDGLGKAAQAKAHHTSHAAKARSIKAAIRASRSPPLFRRCGETALRLAEVTVTGSIVRKFIT
jgi:hypothetical protein